MNINPLHPGYRNRLSTVIAVAANTLFCLPFAGQVAAQETFMLEEVVVTARKREETLQDVPIAVSAFGENQLEAMGANETTELVNRVPNLAYDGGGNALSGMGIRGIVTTTRNIGFESGMGVYVDQVYQGRPIAFNQTLVDVAQVEVLRGPQGTLFGRNTIAGAINISTKKPNHEAFEGKAKLSLGNHNTVNGSLYLTGPLSDTLAGKISVFSQTRDGYAVNHFNGEKVNDDDKKGVRVGLNWLASDDVEVSFNADYMKQDMDRFFSELTAAPTFPFAPPPFTSDAGAALLDPYAGNDYPNESAQDGSTYENRELGGASVHVTWGLDNGMSVTSITAYRIADFDLGADDDSRPAPLSDSQFTDTSDSFTQELRLESSTGEQFNWMLGLYVLDQTADASRATTISSGPQVGTTNINGYVLQPFGAIASESSIDTQAAAIFFNSTYDFSDALSLSVGLRYTKESKDLDFMQQNQSFTTHPDITTSLSLDDNAMSGNVALNYNLSEDSSVYVSVARGFKSGGFNPDIVPSNDIAFDSETVLSYEAGYKADLADGRVRVNGAVFFTDYSDLQVQRLAITNVGTGFAISNANSAEIKGFEGEIIALVTEGLQLEASVGYADSEYTDFDNCGGTADAISNFNSNIFGGTNLPIELESCNGNQLVLAPKVTGSAAAQYSHSLGDGEMTYRLEWGYKGETYAEPNNFDRTHVASHDVTNVRIGYVSADDSWSMAAWGKNITDDEYEEFTWLIPSFNNVFSTYNIGATYGVDVVYNF